MPPYDPDRAEADQALLATGLAFTEAQTEQTGHVTPQRPSEAPAEASETLQEQRLGRFTQLQLVGQGGMGTVYTAYDEILGRRVALKSVRTDRGSSEAHGRILHEAKALARLSHPNVVQIYEVSAVAGKIFLAMEYVQGGTLRAWVVKQRAAGGDHRKILDMFVEAGRGLVAAHARGLVHRDFKPDNVLVGEDGRPRVVDFGLVMADAAAEGETSVGTSRTRLTAPGAILGTPAYMSPEQIVGEASDARSDQFSFCAALYEALCGVRPFSGASFAELAQAVTLSRLSEPVTPIPRWLLAILRRGLASLPQDRFPSMEALLAALAHDPAVARKRRLRALGLAGLSAVVAVVVALVGLEGRQQWLRREHEQTAARALASAETRIDEALAAGDAAVAAQTFAAFAADPLHQGTAALAQGWLGEAARRERAGARGTAQAAFAAAYVGALTGEQRIEALTGLARLFRARLAWQPLAHLLGLLEREHPAVARRPEFVALGVDTALARRDVAAIRALPAGHVPAPVASLADALTAASHTGLVGIEKLAVGDGHALLVQRQADRLTLHLAGLGPSLTPERSFSLPAGTWEAHVARGDPSLVVVHGGEHHTVYRIGDEGLAPVYSWDGAGPFAAAAVDLDGDGARALYISTGTGLEILAVEPDASGTWQARTVYSRADTLLSAGHAMLPIDLDGDGQDALAIAFNGWRAYDVRVVDQAADGSLQTVARDKIGSAHGLATLRRGDRRLLVANVGQVDVNSLMFPSDRPRAEAGLYLYSLDGGQLRREQHLSLPPQKGTVGLVYDSPNVGDVNGDGRDDIAVTSSETHMVLQLQGEDGGFVPALLGDLEFLGVAQLDGDPAHELVVNVPAADGTRHLWVLGAGTDRLPPVEFAGAPAPALVDPDDASWTRRWDQAATLQELGAHAEAASAFQELGQASPKPALRAAAQLYAGNLHERVGAMRAALAAFLEAAETPALAATALQGVLRAQLRLGEYTDAARTLKRLLAHPELADVVRAELTRRYESLVGIDGERVELDFSGPLAPAWTIEDPAALRREPGAAALAIDTNMTGVLASIPVEWSGRLIELTAEFSLLETEWSSQIEFALVPEAAPGSRALVSVWVSTFGTSLGGVEIARAFACKVDGLKLKRASHFHWLPDRTGVEADLRIRVAANPALGERSCEVRERLLNNHDTHRERLDGPLPAAGRYRLVIRTHAEQPARLTARLRKLTVHGARLIDEPAEDRPQAALRRAMVDGDPVATLAGFDEVGAHSQREEVWRAHALLLRGQVAAAREVWRAALTDRPEPALMALFRADPGLYGPHLREIAQDGYPALITGLWRNAAVNHIDDPRTQRDLFTLLTPLDADALMAEAGDDEAKLGHICELLAWRGALLARSREPARARGDFERALAAAERLDPAAPQARDRWALWLELASLAAAEGNEAGAREAMRQAHLTTDMPALVDDLVQTRPELAALAGPPP